MIILKIHFQESLRILENLGESWRILENLPEKKGMAMKWIKSDYPSLIHSGFRYGSDVHSGRKRRF